MKAQTFASAIAVAALATSAVATVTMNIARTQGPIPGLKKRQLSRRSITESLANNFTGGDYIAQVSVGSPAQTQTLLIDTGSSDVWLLSANADLCTSALEQEELGTGGCASTFDSSKSSSFKIVDRDGFTIQYADNSGATGDYVTDSFTIGGSTIKALQMGLAYNVTLQTGLMGIGYDTNEASTEDSIPYTYPSIIDQMVSQDLISTKAYSLYLDDYEASTGSILFGGLDSDKFTGNLLEIPIVPEETANGTGYREFGVPMTGFSITDGSGKTTTITNSTFKQVAILDSGTTLSYLPSSLTTAIYKSVKAVADERIGLVFVPCSLRDKNPKMTFNFGFGGSSGVSIAVPVSELVFDLTGLFDTGGQSPASISGPACAFAIFPGDDGTDNEGPYILGDVFLRSAYVVYDLTNNLIAIAQTNFNSTTSSIVEFKATQTSIPNVSGVASSAQITETGTATAAPVGPGLKTTSTSGPAGKTGTPSSGGTGGGSGTGSSPASTTSSKSSGASRPAAFDMSGFLVLGITSTFTILGATFLLA